MTINFNLSLLRRWWPALVPASLAAYHEVSPQIKIWVAAHPSAAVWIGAAGTFFAILLKSPVAQSVLTENNSSLAATVEKARKG